MDLELAPMLRSIQSTGIALFDVLNNAISTMVTWVYTLWVALFNNTGSWVVFRPLILIGTAVFFILIAIRLVRYISWGA